MRSFLLKIKGFVLSLWMLPQESIACFLLLGYIWRKRILYMLPHHSAIVFRVEGFKGGVSLGRIVFVGRYDKSLVMHEYGHCRQSLYLGPLYLVVIGIPSLIWCKIYKRVGKPYGWFYTEHWADKLGA